MDPMIPDRQLVPIKASGSLSRRPLAGLLTAVRNAAQPVALERPRVDPNLPKLSGLERAAEVIRYTGDRLEYWLSPGGHLRAWVKVNLLLGLLLAIPVVLVMPVITFFLATVTTWTQYILTAAINILQTLLAVAAMAALVTTAMFLLRRLRR